jgi:uncharacterized protein (UPF0335 family)
MAGEVDDEWSDVELYYWEKKVERDNLLTQIKDVQACIDSLGKDKNTTHAQMLREKLKKLKRKESDAHFNQSMSLITRSVPDTEFDSSTLNI